MQLDTVKIRNKKTGRIKIINQADWAGDLGVSRYAGWERAGGEKRGEEGAEEEAAKLVAENEKNAIKERNEASIEIKQIQKNEFDPVEISGKENNDIGDLDEYNTITVAKIKTRLDEMNIEYSQYASKGELFALLKGGNIQ